MRRIMVFLMVIILLSGCAAQKPKVTATLPTIKATQATEATEMTGYYDPDSLAQTQTGGAVFAYPLPRSHGSVIYAVGQKQPAVW